MTEMKNPHESSNKNSPEGDECQLLEADETENQAIDKSESPEVNDGENSEDDPWPDDIKRIICKCLGPKHSAKMSVINKSFDKIVKEDGLWKFFLHQERPCGVFAESEIRSLRSCHSAPDLPWRTVYWLRVQMPRALIVDTGCGYTRIGWSRDIAPSASSNLSFGCGRFGTSYNWEAMQEQLSCIHTKMHAERSRPPVVVSMPIHHIAGYEYHAAAKWLEEALVSTLLDMDVPAVCVVNEAILALFAAKELSGIVVHIGMYGTSIVPVRHGKIMHQVGVTTTEIGAEKIPIFPPSGNIANIQILGGFLNCSVPGNLTRPIVGAPVRLSCDGGSTTLARFVTDSQGNINNTGLVPLVGNILNNGLLPFIFNLLAGRCALIVDLPLPAVANCTALPNVGRLEAPLTFLNIILQSIFGLTIVLLAGVFRLITG